MTVTTTTKVLPPGQLLCPLARAVCLCPWMFHHKHVARGQRSNLQCYRSSVDNRPPPQAAPARTHHHHTCMLPSHHARLPPKLRKSFKQQVSRSVANFCCEGFISANFVTMQSESSVPLELFTEVTSPNANVRPRFSAPLCLKQLP